MTSGDFEHKNQERWAEYERLVARLEKGEMNGEAAEMPRRFRELCVDLSLAESRMYGARITERLNALVIRGYEVIYTGLHQTVEQIVRTAVQEAVDVVGLSIMSGAHLPICQNLLNLMKNEGLGEIPVVVGGVIPKQDIAKLNKLGIVGVFPGGTPFDEIVAGIHEIIR